MATSTADERAQVAAVSVSFDRDWLCVALSDGREVRLSLETTPWLRWLRDAEAARRANWVIEPGAYAVYWPDLDDGVEVCHLLAAEPVV